MAEIRSVTVVVNGNVRGLTAAYNRGKIATNDFADSLERAEGHSEKLRQSQSKLATTTSRNSQRYQSLTKSLNDTSTALGRHNSQLGTSARSGEQLGRSTLRTSKSTEQLGKSLKQGERDIDRYSGRLALLLQAGVALGPGLAAGAIPALIGLSAQLGASGVGAGVMLAAFQGVGDGLKAVNKAALEPTTANLNDARVAMSKLTPEGQQLVRTLMDAKKPLGDLRDVAQQEMFPGIVSGIDKLETRFPQLEQLVGSTAAELGNIFDDIGSSLSSDDWDAAFNYAIASTPALLDDTAHSAGALVKTMMNLWVALQPLTGDWSSGFREAAEAAERWSSSVGDTAGFQRFLAYAGDVGPEVAHTLGELFLMLVKIGQAAAPVSGPLIKLLGEVAELTGDIAGSDIGAPIVAGMFAMTAYNRALQLRVALEKRLQVAQAGSAAGAGSRLGMSVYAGQIRDVRTLRTDLASLRRQQLATRELTGGMVNVPLLRKGAAETTRVTSAMKGLGKTAAGVAGVGLAASGMADKIGLSHTASLALIGTMAGPWGAAAGAATGAVLDLASATDSLAATTQNADRLMRSSSVNVDALIKQRTQIKKQLDDTSWFNKNVNPWGVNDALEAESTYRELGSQITDLKGRAAGGPGLGKLLFSSLGKGATQYGAELDRATGAQERFLDSVTNANNILSGRSNWAAWKQSILDAKDALAQNGKTLDANTDKGLANYNAITAMGNAAVTAAQDMKGIRQATYLGNARKQFVQLATDMGMGRAAARRLADSLGLLNGVKAQPKVDLDTGPLKRKTSFADNVLNLLGKKKPTPKADLDNKRLSAKYREGSNFLQVLGRKHPTPKADLKDNVSGKARNATGAVNTLGGKRAVPKADLRDGVSGPARNALGLLNQVDGKVARSSIVVTTIRRTVGAGVQAGAAAGVEQARGGVWDRGVQQFAVGGIVKDAGDMPNRHQPKMYAGGYMARGFAEEETKGEIYAPLANDSRRPRAKKIVEYGVNRMGGTVDWNALGSITPGKDYADYRVSVLQAEQDIADIRAELNATKIVGQHKVKRGKKTVLVGGHRVKALSGHARTLKNAEYRAALLNLQEIKAQYAYDAAAPERQAQIDADKNRAQASADAAKALASSTSDLSGKSGIFARGASANGALTSINRQIKAVSDYGQVMSQLRAAKASPALLAQVVSVAESGDIASAVRMAKSLLANPAALQGVNASLDELNRVTSSVAAFTNSAAFTSGTGALAAPVTGKTVEVNLNTDPSAQTKEIVRLVKHEVGVALADENR